MNKRKKSKKKKKQFKEPILIIEAIKNGSLAIIVGLAINILIYYFGVLLDVLGNDEIKPDTNESIGLNDIITMTLFWMLFALIVFLIFIQFMENPVEIYRTVAVTALLASFILPLGVQNGGIFTIILLDMMHVTSATLILYFLTTRKLY